MRKNPERLAWAILLISFALFVSLAIAIPLGIRHYILYAYTGQNVILEVQQAPLRVIEPNRSRPVAVAEKLDDIHERTTVATDATAGRLVIHTPQPEGPVIATVQLYDYTEVTLTSARSPRFSTSRLPHKVTLDVRTGRVRINVSSDDGRPTVIEVRTPHGATTLQEGSFEVKVNGTATEVTVRNGQAQVTNDALHPDQNSDEAVPLGPAQRAIVEDGSIAGPLPAARNLVINGDLQTSLENGWTSYHEQKEEPPGSVSITIDEGRKVANFYRNGSNHAEVGIWQDVNYDVRDFTSLELHLAVNIVHENIAGYGGCGTLSSECPTIVLIDYKDIHGTDRQWRHGFYIGEPAPDWLLYPWTEQIPAGTWQTYDSGNLMEELADTPPAIIKRLTIYASGHSFHAMVTEVELLAQE